MFKSGSESSKRTQDKSTLILTAKSKNKDETTEIETIKKRLENLEKIIYLAQEENKSDKDSLNYSSDQTSLDNSIHTGPCCSYACGNVVFVQNNALCQQNTVMATHNNTRERCRHYDKDAHTFDEVTSGSKRQQADSSHLGSLRYPHSSVKSANQNKSLRDFKVMDTVHYLAQGEFAPRNDGIKLTPSREAVLSDIIWEDVCRSHWPTTKLIRRGNRKEKLTQRTELHRLIDTMLRDRIAHIEKRKRKQVRVTKVHHSKENRNGLGFIVANDTDYLDNRRAKEKPYTSDDCVMIQDINKKLEGSASSCNTPYHSARDLRCAQKILLNDLKESGIYSVIEPSDLHLNIQRERSSHKYASKLKCKKSFKIRKEK